MFHRKGPQSPLEYAAAEGKKDDENRSPRPPRPAQAPRYSAYEHLARIKEWTAADGGEDT